MSDGKTVKKTQDTLADLLQDTSEIVRNSGVVEGAKHIKKAVDLDAARRGAMDLADDLLALLGNAK